MRKEVPDYEKVREHPDRSPGEQSVTTITCVVCGGHILTVPARTAEAFASGSWVCSQDKCYDELAARTAAEGKLT